MDGVILIRQSDQKKYGSLIQMLTSQYSMGTGQYPRDMTTATDILANHKWDNTKKFQKTEGQSNEKMEKSEKNNEKEGQEKSFAQDYIWCYYCGQTGHKVTKCAKKVSISR